jgi:hypothetical protein
MVFIVLAVHYFKTDASARGSAAKRKSSNELPALAGMSSQEGSE